MFIYDPDLKVIHLNDLFMPKNLFLLLVHICWKYLIFFFDKIYKVAVKVTDAASHFVSFLSNNFIFL